MKVAHLTSAHPRYDARIFLKQCRSLAEAGHEVHLVVADGKGDEAQTLVRIHDVGIISGRLKRMLSTTKKVHDKAVELDADIYHLHDPELLPVGYRLKKAGKRVVFDSHEDVPVQILDKPYLSPVMRKIVSRIFSIYESWVCSRLDAVVSATQFINEKFLKINPRSVVVYNFPMLDELSVVDVAWSEKKDQVCYIGSIAKTRGVVEIVDAIGCAQGGTQLALAGDLERSALTRILEASNGWARTKALGFLDRDGVKRTLGESRAGLVTLHPTRSYLDALPVKMFEYMAAGVPVITSDFPLWREIVEKSQCGTCVNPLDAAEIASAISWFVQNPAEAEVMGNNGRRAVKEHYNWDVEKGKLLDLYRRIEQEV
ncbi:glycosyltransferase family 4 protein [Pseudomonas asiatica]|uniref:glycosyltransferase family 4 protein n=1 Tax=Pseudomonas asiatica TaxID=2219225 RepID=UPI003999DB34